MRPNRSLAFAMMLAITAVVAIGSGTPASATTTSQVFTSSAQVDTWDPIIPAAADPTWETTTCVSVPAVGLGATWTNPHKAFDFGSSYHPWQQDGTAGFSANWINAWSNIRSQGPDGQSWTKYSTQVSGTGSFVLDLLADNCSWIYLDGTLVGFQGENLSQTRTYPVNLNGTHTLSFLIFDGGGAAGGMFRLETNLTTVFPTTTSVSFGPGPYVAKGSPFSATATVFVGSVAQSVVANITYSGNCVDAGSICTANASYPGDATRGPSTGSASITIAARPPSLEVAAGGGNAAYYADWTSANPGAGTAAGTITLPGGSQVHLSFTAVGPNGEVRPYLGAQTSCGTNFWMPSAPYVSTEVPNAPPACELLQLSGGNDTVYRVDLSEPIRDPIMSIVSLGAPGIPTTYNFDSPFTILSQGPGYFGGSDASLVHLTGNVLRGNEGHGTIKFLGTYSTFSWKVPTNEYWHGFTFAIRATDSFDIAPNEGQTATNYGTWGHPDGLAVSLTASVGTITKNADGTWAWSLLTTDGPAQSQTVTVTATDTAGGTTSRSFQLVVKNVPPTASLANNGPVNVGVPATIMFSGPGDPSADDLARLRYAFSCTGASLDSSTYATSSTSPSTSCTFSTGGNATVRARVIDKDGGFSEYTTVVTVNAVRPTTTTVTFGDGPFVYKGTPFTATAKVFVGSVAQDVVVDVTYSGDCTNAGSTCTATATYPGDATRGPSSNTASITIDKAPSTTTVSFGQGPFIYTGSAFTAIATVRPSGTATIEYSGDCTNPGTTCTATATYAGDANHLGSTATASITITYTLCPGSGGSYSHPRTAGSTIPVKIKVCSAGGQNLGSTALTVKAIGVTPSASLDDSGKANPGNLFRFDDGTYIFNLSTKTFASGSYTLEFVIGADPTIYRYAFQIR